MKKIFNVLCCCFKSNYPQWLTHLIYQCNNKRKTSQWCHIFIDNYRFLTDYDHDYIKTIHQTYNIDKSQQQLIGMMEADISKHNGLYMAIGFFASYVKIKYAQTITPTGITINRIKKDFQQFMHVFKDCTILYYDLDKLEGLFNSQNFNRQILTSFIVKIIFDNDQFRQTINQLQRKVDKQSNQKVQFNMQKFGVLRPQQYGIAIQYCLNQNTLKSFNINPSGNLLPYSNSIELVRQIVKQKYPQQKLKKLQAVINSIQQTIKKFYSQYQLKQYTPLNADSLISILVYIIVQSKQSNLNSHLKIIKNYSSRQTLNSSMGYSLVSIEACLQFIEKGNIKRSNGVTVPESDLSLWMSLQNYFETSNNKDY